MTFTLTSFGPELLVYDFSGLFLIEHNIFYASCSLAVHEVGYFFLPRPIKQSKRIKRV